MFYISTFFVASIVGLALYGLVLKKRQHLGKVLAGDNFTVVSARSSDGRS